MKLFVCSSLEQVYHQKKLVADLSHRVQQIRANTKRKKIEINDKTTRVDDCKKRIKDLTSTLEEIESQKLNVEDRTKRLEKMIEVCLFCKFVVTNRLII